MDSMSEINFLSIHEALRQMQDGTLTPRALTEACFRQIERLNPKLNAFITVCDVTASEAWQSHSNEEIAARRKSPLATLAHLPHELRGVRASAGVTLKHIPLAVKDLFETKGIRTTAGSLFFKDYIPNEDAAVIQKIKAAGAVIMGKTNTHEIALGVTTNNPHFGTTRNPWDSAHIPGGSSGGSAVAVATGMCLAALGTDTGGSIRIPASLCGVVGLKPTYGRISLRGVFPLSWNLDHVGPITRTVKDAALILQIIAGYDTQDPLSINMRLGNYLNHLEDTLKGKKIALAAGAYIEESDAEVIAAVNETVKVFASLGTEIEKVEMDFLREAALANTLITQADGAAFHRERLVNRPDWFGADVRQRLETGRSFSSTEYSLARRTQAEMKHRFVQLFEIYDFLLLPATPITAPLIEGNAITPKEYAVEQASRLTRFTSPFNLTGLPAISVPCGFNKAGLPIGLQIVAKSWDEATLLRAAHAYERETNWGTHRPSLVHP
jgi:aspartyl-tRNA(Asn)/glutamyl-tRNA(Gln) amidotransferase subunit A